MLYKVFYIFPGQGSSSVRKQPAASLSKKPTSTAVKPSTSGAGAKRSFVKASWSIQNELLEHDEKDPTTMVANLKRIKAEAEGQRYTTLGTFWTDYLVYTSNKMWLEIITCLSNIIFVMCLILPIRFGLPKYMNTCINIRTFYFTTGLRRLISMSRGYSEISKTCILHITCILMLIDLQKMEILILIFTLCVII